MNLTCLKFVPAGLEEIDKSDGDIKTTLSNYIYGGPIHEIRVLRGQAWLWILVHPEWVFQWTQALVNQCYDRGSTHFWNKDVSTKYRARVYQGQVVRADTIMIDSKSGGEKDWNSLLASLSIRRRSAHGYPGKVSIVVTAYPTR